MNGSIRKMMRVTCGMLLMVMSGVSQSAELTLESHGSRGGQLRDGEKSGDGADYLPGGAHGFSCMDE